MKRRVFVAIPIPDRIKREIVAWQKGYAHLQVRWTKPENFHITMVPPWYVTESELNEVMKILGSNIKEFKSFKARFEKILFGPPGQPPRLIWAEGETPEEFKSFKSLVEDALLENPETGFHMKESRPAKLHLTIARFRPGTIKKPPPLNGGINWNWEVDQVNLMESELKRTGAEYALIRRFR